jgi:membrane protease YdiL (CAAX protease family)
MFLEPKVLPSLAASRWTPRLTRWDIALLGCLILLAASAGLSIWNRASGHEAAIAHRVVPSAWNMALTLAITGGIPFLWLMRTRARPLTGTLDYLRLRNLRRAAPYGLAVGLTMAIAALALLHARPSSPTSAAALLQASFFWVLVGPLGEEILFRGVLQPRLGILGQAAAFTLLHVAAVTPLQAVVVLGAGIALGATAHRWGLWASIVAHAIYNLVALL